MNVQQALSKLKSEGLSIDDLLSVIEESDDLRKSLVDHFRQHPDRELALSILRKLTGARERNAESVSSETLMLACYIVGLHQQVEDCLAIWNTKETDFDTACGVDIQLTVFAGVKETIAYLETQHATEAKHAHEYILRCDKAGDFEQLDLYYHHRNLPWYI